MYCKYCGTQLTDDARFCSSCGKNLAESAPAASENEPIKTEPLKEETKPAKKLELMPIIAAGVLGLMSFINMIIGMSNGSIVNIFANMFMMGSAALFILTVFGILKKDNLFYAIGMFAFAFAEMVRISEYYWWVAVLIIPALVLAGLYYILKGKIFGGIIKMIMAIAAWTVGLILFIVYCVNGVSEWFLISDTLIYAAIGLCIFSYTPYKK